MNDAPYRNEDTEEDQEAADAVIHIIEFHAPGSVETLADLDGEGDDQDHRRDVEEGDDHSVPGPGKPEEDGVEDQDHGDAESTDNNEVQFLVGEAVLALIVQRQEVAVDLGDQHDHVIQKCFHLISPYIHAKAGKVLRVSHSITGLCVDCEKNWPTWKIMVDKIWKLNYDVRGERIIPDKTRIPILVKILYNKLANIGGDRRWISLLQQQQKCRIISGSM